MTRCPDGEHDFARSKQNALIICTKCGEGECSIALQAGTLPGEHRFRYKTQDNRLACLCGTTVKDEAEAAEHARKRLEQFPSLKHYSTVL